MRQIVFASGKGGTGKTTLTALMALSGAYPLDYLLNHYTPYALLISWGEAFTTGMMVTVMVVYRPAWVETFDDVKYIQNK